MQMADMRRGCKNMKYLIVGAGGTGGVVGYYMTKAGKNVTLIARGAHLKQMQTKGLTLEKMWDQSTETIPVKASDMEHYTEQPDVILVCVKGYSLEDTIPFIQKVAKKDTVVIPILNIYGTGAKMQKKLQELLVTDGCIYVSANIKEPGVLLQYFFCYIFCFCLCSICLQFHTILCGYLHIFCVYVSSTE